jgi:hypothetical protein
MSTASSLSKGKNIPSAAAAAAPSSGNPVSFLFVQTQHLSTRQDTHNPISFLLLSLRTCEL